MHNVGATEEVAKTSVRRPAEVTWEGAKWSCDGGKIAWVERTDETSSLNIYYLDTTHKKAVSVQGIVSTFGWHPKEDRIVICLSDSGGSPMPSASYLREMTLANGRVRPLACVDAISGSLMQPAYSWRGDKLAVVLRDRTDAGMQIAVVENSQPSPVLVVSDKNLNQHPTWLRNDVGLVYEKSVADVSTGHMVRKFFALILLHGRKEEILFDSTEYHSSYFTSVPGNGARVRYVRYPKRPGKIPQLCEYNVSTAERTILLDFENVFASNWEENGLGFAARAVGPDLALAVVSADKRLRGVWLLSLAGHAAARVADEPNARWPQLSPDGKLMSFVNSDGDVVILDVSGASNQLSQAPY